MENITCLGCARTLPCIVANRTKEGEEGIKFKIFLCRFCNEIMIADSMESTKYRIMTAKEFILYMSYDDAMQVAEIIQHKDLINKN